MVEALLRPWRHQRREQTPQEKSVAEQYPWYVPRKAMWLVLKPEQRTPEEQAFVTEVLHQSSILTQAVSLVQAFRRLVRDREVEALGPWRQAAESKGKCESK